MSRFSRLALCNCAAGTIVGWLFVAALVLGDISGIGAVLARGEQSLLAIAMLLTAVGTLFGVAALATSISFADPANAGHRRHDDHGAARQTGRSDG